MRALPDRDIASRLPRRLPTRQ